MYLLKTEPSEYSYDQLERDTITKWDGVKNPLAQKFISQMKVGDLCFIYHTGKEKAIVGIAKVASMPYKDEKGFWVVDVKPHTKLKRPVSLQEIKGLSQAKDSYLIKIPRLSVMPISEDLWKAILSLL